MSVTTWTPKVETVIHARHKGMLKVVLGEMLEHKRIFEHAAQGREDLIGTHLPINQRTGAYQTASGGQTGEGITLLVTFADDAKAMAISQLLTEVDGSIVDGPKAGGVYKVRLRTVDRSPAAREALMRKLTERRDVVRAVLPSRD